MRSALAIIAALDPMGLAEYKAGQVFIDATGPSLAEALEAGKIAFEMLA